MHTRGDLADLTTLERDLPELSFGVLRREEEEALTIGRPLELIDIVLEAVGEEGLLPCLQILDEETLEVGFVAVALHADPADALAIRREAGVRVIATHPLGDIASLTRGEVVEIDIGVGGEGVLHARLLAGGVG